MPLTISRRCQSIAPSLTLAIDARAKEMKAQGLPVIGFGAGEPDFDTPAFIREAGKKALDLGLTRYTPVPGTVELRKAICQKLARDNQLTYEPSQIIVSSGAKHTLFNVFQAIIDPGDEVLVPAPCWVSYPEMVRMAGGIPVIVHAAEENNFVATAQDLAPYITARTKALILNSPNNPNGCIWNRQQLADIAQLAVDKGFYVVSDEIYEKLLYDGQEHVSIASLGEKIYQQTIVVNGMSKAYAMTGWRIGYAAGPKAVVAAMSNYQSHATSNANTMAQYASAAALEGNEDEVRAMVAAFDTRRRLIVDLIRQISGLSCKTPLGAFYVMLNIGDVLGKRFRGKQITGSMDFADALLDSQCVAVVPGIAFEADAYCRLSYAISEAKIKEGLARIAAFVRELED